MSIITTVALTEEDKRFIEENSISLSKLVRKTIKEKRESASHTNPRNPIPGKKRVYNV